MIRQKLQVAAEVLQHPKVQSHSRLLNKKAKAKLLCRSLRGDVKILC